MTSTTVLLDMLQQNPVVRDEFLGVLNDAMLKHSLGGNTLTLGALFKQMGDFEYAYIQSFKTFKQDFSYQNPEGGLTTSVDKLRAWYKKLDEEFAAALNGLSEADIQNRMIDQGGREVSVERNFQSYREAMMMFCSKVSIYIKAMSISLPDHFKAWIG